MNLGEISIHCGLKAVFFVGVSLCIVCRSNISAARAFWIQVPAPALLSVLAMSLEIRCDWGDSAQSLQWMWGRAPSLLLVITALGGRVSVPAVGVEALRVRFDKVPLPLSVSSLSLEGGKMKQVRSHVHSKPVCHPHRHLWLCPEATQILSFFPLCSSQIWCWAVLWSELVLGPGALGCRNWGGYVVPWNLGCLCGTGTVCCEETNYPAVKKVSASHIWKQQLRNNRNFSSLYIRCWDSSKHPLRRW